MKKLKLKIYGVNYNTKDGSIRDFIHVFDIKDTLFGFRKLINLIFQKY